MKYQVGDYVKLYVYKNSITENSPYIIIKILDVLEEGEEERTYTIKEIYGNHIEITNRIFDVYLNQKYFYMTIISPEKVYALVL